MKVQHQKQHQAQQQAIQNLPAKPAIAASIITIIALLCAGAAFLVVSYYIIFPSRGYFHSDCTDTLYWAQASYDARAVFNKDFTYAGLMPFGGSLLMLPWIGIFGVSMTTQTIGMLLFLVLFTGAIILLLRTLGWKTGWIAATVAMMLALLSLSEKSREMFWSHIIYYSLGLLMFFVGLSLAIRVFRLTGAGGPADRRHGAGGQAGRRRIWLAVGLLLCWLLLCSTNGFQMAAVFILPIILAVLSQWFFHFERRLADPENARGNLLVLLMTIALLAGLVLGLVLANGQQANYENGYSAFDDSNNWFANLGKFPGHWAYLTGVQTKNGDLFISVAGILNLLKLAAGLAILVVPLVMLLMCRRIKEPAVRILVLAHWFMTAVVMFGYVFGVLSAASWRLLPIVGSSIFLTFVFIKWIVDQARAWRLLPIIMLPLVLASAISLVTIARMPPDYGQDKGVNAVQGFLVENGLSYGYATFWNANSVTVLSNSRVKVRSVNISAEGVEPYYYQSERQWFDDQPGQDRYFLLLEKYEYDILVGGSAAWDSKAIEKLEYQGYIILVYPENVMNIVTASQ